MRPIETERFPKANRIVAATQTSLGMLAELIHANQKSPTGIAINPVKQGISLDSGCKECPEEF